MIKRIIVAVLLLIAVAAGLALYLYHKPHRGVENQRPDTVIDAASLYSAFAGNEAAANKQFLDRVLEVKGSLHEIGHDQGRISLQLMGEGAAGGINCILFDTTSIIRMPAPGSFITIKGRCTGFLADVQLVDCVLIK